MNKPYFIMMYNQQGTVAMPIICNDYDEDYDDEGVMFFSTEEDARKLAMNHTYCQAFGYEIFCMGEGEI